MPGINRFISVGDASVISAMMMVNEKGLAGSADVGGLKVDEPRHRGWMNTAILRHIAERAGDCQEALAIVQEFVSKGWYAGGGQVGTHWLFVDVKGRILEISHNSTRLEHSWHDDAKVYFSAPRGRAIARLEEAAPPVDFATFHNVVRDPAMCFPSSVSGMSVRIDAARPELLTQAWISMPARSLSFPLVMGGAATPLALLTGQADAERAPEPRLGRNLGTDRGARFREPGSARRPCSAIGRVGARKRICPGDRPVDPGHDCRASRHSKSIPLTVVCFQRFGELTPFTERRIRESLILRPLVC